MYSPASIIAICVVLPLLGVFTVGLRFYVRTFFKRGLGVGIDDWLILAGCVVVLCMAANEITATAVGGLGRHTAIDSYGAPIVDPRTQKTVLINYPQDVIEKVGYGLIKLSVLFFYRRVFNSSDSTKQAASIMIAIIGLWAFAFLLASIFICGGDPGTLWSKSTFYGMHSHNCGSTSMLLLWFAITDVIGDIAVLALPFPRIRRMKVSKREKWGISGILLLGTLSTAAGVVRLGLVSQAFSNDFSKGGDIEGGATPPWTWTTIEASVGLIAASLPPLAPLIRKTPSLSEIGEGLRLTLSPHASRKQSSPSALNVNAANGHQQSSQMSQATTLGSSSVTSPRSPLHSQMRDDQRQAIDLLEARGLRGFAVYGDAAAQEQDAEREELEKEKKETPEERLRRIERDMV